MYFRYILAWLFFTRVIKKCKYFFWMNSSFNYQENVVNSVL